MRAPASSHHVVGGAGTVHHPLATSPTRPGGARTRREIEPADVRSSAGRHPVGSSAPYDRETHRGGLSRGPPGTRGARVGPADGGAAGPDPALRPLVIEIGTAMIGAGDAVEIVEDHLRRILAAYRVNDAQLALLPTSLFVEFGGGGHAGYVQFASGVPQSLRLDQIAALYQLVHELEAGDIHPAEGRRRLVAVYEMAPRFAAPIRTIGHAVLTAGLALLLVPTWEGVLAALVLGFAIGALKLASLPTLRLILPIAAAALSSILVFAVAHVVDLHDPVRLLVAPLATFIPGSVLAIATIELAAGQIVSGASRLVS